MKQRVNRAKAVALILNEVNKATDITIEWYNRKLPDMKVDMDFFRKICYAYYLCAARFGLISFQRLRMNEDVKMLTVMIKKIVEDRFDGKEEHSRNIMWLINQLYGEVDSVFSSYYKPLKELQKIYAEHALVGEYTEQEIVDAQVEIDHVFHDFGQDMLKWFRREIKIIP